jgi:hypothetical protein
MPSPDRSAFLLVRRGTDWGDCLLVRLVVGLRLYLVMDRFLFAVIADFPGHDGLAVWAVQRETLRPNPAVWVGLGLLLELVPCPVLGRGVDVGYDCADQAASRRRTDVYGESLCPYDAVTSRYALDLLNCHGTVIFVEKCGQLLDFRKPHGSHTLSRRTYAERNVCHLPYPLTATIWPTDGPTSAHRAAIAFENVSFNWWSGRRESNPHDQLGRLLPSQGRLLRLGGVDQQI